MECEVGVGDGLQKLGTQVGFLFAADLDADGVGSDGFVFTGWCPVDQSPQGAKE